MLYTIILTVRPRWTVEPTDKQFAQGSNAKVDCKADGFPQPTISWEKAVGKLHIITNVTNCCLTLCPMCHLYCNSNIHFL